MNEYSILINQKLLKYTQRVKNDFKPEPTSSSPYRLAAQVYSLRGYGPFSGRRNKEFSKTPERVHLSGVFTFYS